MQSSQAEELEQLKLKVSEASTLLQSELDQVVSLRNQLARE